MKTCTTSSQRRPRRLAKTAAVALAAAALPWGSTPALAGRVVFSDAILTTPDGLAQLTGVALAVNNAGQVVGSYVDPASGDWRAFLWRPGFNGGTVDIGSTAAGATSSANAITDPAGVRGTVQIAGTVTNASGLSHGFVQTRNNLLGTVLERQFTGASGEAMFVGGVNAAGVAMGTFTRPGGTTAVPNAQAFSSSPAGGITTLGGGGGGGGATSGGFAINNAGQAAGYISSSATGGYRHAAVFEGGAVRDLGTLGGGNSQARAISQNGWVVGFSQETASGQYHAFVHRDGAMRRIAGNLDQGGNSYAHAVNSVGQVAGWVLPAVGRSTAFIHSVSSGAVSLEGRTFGLLGSAIDVISVYGMNDLGQMVGRSATGNAVLLSPVGTLTWNQLRGGRVADPVNWDSGLGFSPNRLLDVEIASATSQTVTADSSFSAQSLQVGGATASGTGGLMTLQLSNGAVVNPTYGLVVEPSGRLQGQGRVAGINAVLNRGTVVALPGQTLTLDSGLDNRGVVTGEGRIEANLINRGGGAAGVVVSAGQSLTLAGTVHSSADGSQIHVASGSSLTMEGRFVHQGGARLFIDGGRLQAGYGANRMANGGQILVRSGVSAILGDLNNGTRGLVHASGAARLTMWDPVLNDGEFRASEGAQIVYVGMAAGRGAYSSEDAGSFHRFIGGFSPGATAGPSVAEAELGDVQFASPLTLDIGGLAPGTGHDHLVFSASVLFDVGSALTLRLVNGFAPAAGDVFGLFSYAQAPSGFLRSDALPGLAAGLQWDVSQLHTSGQLLVASVPEPGTWALWCAGLGCLGFVVRRRA